MPSDRGDYRTFYCSFWDDADVLNLSDLAYRVLTTLKGTLPATGIGVVYVGQLAGRCGNKPPDAIEKALAELERPTGSNRRGWIVRDLNVVWLINGLRFEPLIATNENHRKFVHRLLKPLGAKSKIIKAFHKYYALWFPDGQGIPSEGDSKGIEMPFEWDTGTPLKGIGEGIPDHVDVDVYGNEDGTKTKTKTSTTKGRAQKRAQPSLESAVFALAWASYPKRAGSNPRPDAWQQWQARVAEGYAEPDMFAGTERYRAFCDATGKTNTEVVMQARRFFGRNREFTDPWDIPSQLPLDQRPRGGGARADAVIDAAIEAAIARKQQLKGTNNGE